MPIEITTPGEGEIVNIDPQILWLNADPLRTPTYAVPSATLVLAEQVINATWKEARASKADFTAKLATALDGFLNVTDAPHISAGSVDIPSIVEPNVTIPTTQSADDVLTEYQTQRLAIVAELVEKFTDFRTTYFQDESTAYVAAEDWLQSAIANPSGLPSAVLSQLLADEQARIIADKTRAQDAVIAKFAGCRFPLLPDVAASITMQIEQKSQDALAEASRKLTALSVEMQKFNVEKLMGLRGMAMDAATKYIAALASGQDVASRVIGVGYDAQSKLISAASDMYRARAGAADVMSKVAQYNNSTQLEAAAKNQQSDLALIEDKLKAMLTEAQTIGQTMTALYNNLHTGATVSTSGNATTAVTGDL